MSDTKPVRPKAGEYVRLSPKGVVHTAWGTHTVCGRPIPDGTVAVNVKTYCRRCLNTPIMTLTYTSGTVQEFYTR